MKHLFYATLFLFATVELGAQCAPTFFDNFETGAPAAAWSAGTGHTMTVNTVNPAVGSYSLHNTGSSAFYSGPNVMFPSSQPTYVSWRIKTNTTTAANGYFVLGDANINSDNGVLFAYCNSTSGLRFFASTGYNHPIAANTWYHVEVMNINWTARTMDIYVNGVLILSAWPFRSPTATSVDRLHTFNLSSATASYDNIQIGIGNSMTLSNSVISPLCNGGTNGSIDLSVTGGTAPFTYNWSNSSTTQDLSGIGAGTYSVTVTDNVGCTSTSSFTVTEPTAISMNVTTTDVTCFAGTNGSADLAASGGTPGYSYAWSNGATTEDVTNFAAGTYTIVLSDANGCTGVSNITITEPAEILSSASVTDVTCGGGSDGSAMLTVSGGMPGYSYAWAPSGGTAATATGLSAGTYSVTITDSVGCTRLQTLSVTEPPAITGTITSTDVTCNGGNDGSAMISASGGTPSYTFSWSSGGTAAVETGLAAGTHTVTVTDSVGCTFMNTITINEPTAMIAADVTTGATCNGGADGTALITVMGGTPGYTFSWSNGDTGGMADSLSAGVYTVTVTDANGCTMMHSVTITEPSAMAITFSVTNASTCGGADGMIDATVTGGTGSLTYQWTPVSAITEDISGLTAGTYTLTVTDSLGCTAMNNADVLNPSLPVVTVAFTSDGPCLDDANITLAGGSPAGGVYTGPGVSGGSFDPSVAGNGVHIITYTYTDANNCTSSATDTITVSPCMGVEEYAVSSWNVYPNPNDGAFTLSANASGSDVTIEVLDMQGRIVFISAENNVTPGFTKQITLGQVSTGMYVLRVINNELQTREVYILSVQR